MRPHVALSLFLSAVPALAGAPASEIPIRRIVLYQHGLGGFERIGVVHQDQTLTLHFKESEMSDVLKSLTVLDLDGGRVEAVAYDSQKPPQKQLEDFGFDLREGDALQGLLSQLQGARVEVEVAGRAPITGSVLGLDHRTERRGDADVRVPRLTVLGDDGRVVSADLFDLKGLRFLDEGLASDIARYLAVLRQTHHRDRRGLELRCAGEGERRVLVAYAVEQPVWKATYRLVVPERSQEERRPLLQGWAIVDNATDEDWTDVELVLVAGMPISFRFDLYTPRFVERPGLDLRRLSEAALRRESPFADAGPDSTLSGRAGKIVAAPAAPLPAEKRMKSRDKVALVEELERQQQAAATREVGELLQYRIEHPVSIPRGRSALLPIVNERVDGRRLSYYDESVRGNHPMSAVRLVNSTGLTLEGGPLTVFEGGDYAGENYLATLRPDEVRYVPFAVDLGVDATTKRETRRERVRRVVVVRGVVRTYRDRVETRTYSFRVEDDEARTIVVHHPRRNGARLLVPSEPSEQDLGQYRFELTVPAGAEGSLKVREAFDEIQTVSISDFTPDLVSVWQENGLLDPAFEAALQDILQRKQRIAELGRRIEGEQKSLDDLYRDQERLRLNLQALPGTTPEEKDLRGTYVEKLAKGEEEVASIRSRLDELRTRLESERGELDRIVSKLAFDYAVR